MPRLSASGVAGDCPAAVHGCQVAKDFGISPSCLKRWLTIDEQRASGSARAGRPASESDALREATKRIRLLEQESEVLRRAAAYLVQANLRGK